MKALLFAIPLCILFSCLKTEDEASKKLTVTLKTGAEVEISADFKECIHDSDCVLVSSGCDQCCQQQAINLAFHGKYDDKFGAACANYHGGVCDCIMTKSTPKCIEHTCQVVADTASSIVR